MTRWEEDQEQIEYLVEWRRTHKRWIVKIHDLTPAWEECRHYFKIRYFAHERTARMYGSMDEIMVSERTGGAVKGTVKCLYVFMLSLWFVFTKSLYLCGLSLCLYESVNFLYFTKKVKTDCI